MMEWTRSNMKINILTLFPEMFSGFKSESIIGKALEKNLLEINIVNIRDFCYDKHKQADDIPFGGGAGMVMKPEPLFRALETVKGKIIYTTPQGVRFNQKLAIELAQEEEITIIAGHYEGMKVPEVLLSGHHKNIETWRLKESLKRTYLRRRDLLVGRELSKEEKKLLAEIKRELGKEKNDI